MSLDFIISLSLHFVLRIFVTTYTAPVGNVSYGTNRYCLELFPLYRVYTGSVPKSSKGFVKS